ncbi:MAG: cell division protein FtsH, partial [Myxococcales bacterium]|nr:cell division protein FtsH [Myxococcales bacterium]
DLANLVNEAALHAIRRKGGLITAEDFAEALDKIQLGDPRELHLSPAEVERIAVHEAGHALVAQLVDKNTPLRRVSIIPRGMALGVTQQSTLGDKHLHTRSELTAKLRLLLGGYAAEKLVLGEVSSGAESDLQRASDLAHRMVAQMGMSDLLGPIHLETRSEHPFLGARLATDGGASDASLHEAEQEVRRVLAEAFDDATEVLERNRATLDLLVAALLEHETLDADQLQALLTGPGPTPSGERMTTGSSASA